MRRLWELISSSLKIPTLLYQTHVHCEHFTKEKLSGANADMNWNCHTCFISSWHFNGQTHIEVCDNASPLASAHDHILTHHIDASGLCAARGCHIDKGQAVLHGTLNQHNIRSCLCHTNVPVVINNHQGHDTWPCVLENACANHCALCLAATNTCLVEGQTLHCRHSQDAGCTFSSNQLQTCEKNLLMAVNNSHVVCKPVHKGWVKVATNILNR